MPPHPRRPVASLSMGSCCVVIVSIFMLGYTSSAQGISSTGSGSSGSSGTGSGSGGNVSDGTTVPFELRPTVPTLDQWVIGYPTVDPDFILRATGKFGFSILRINNSLATSSPLSTNSRAATPQQHSMMRQQQQQQQPITHHRRQGRSQHYWQALQEDAAVAQGGALEFHLQWTSAPGVNQYLGVGIAPTGMDGRLLICYSGAGATAAGVCDVYDGKLLQQSPSTTRPLFSSILTSDIYIASASRNGSTSFASVRIFASLLNVNANTTGDFRILFATGGTNTTSVTNQPYKHTLTSVGQVNFYFGRFIPLQEPFARIGNIVGPLGLFCSFLVFLFCLRVIAPNYFSPNLRNRIVWIITVLLTVVAIIEFALLTVGEQYNGTLAPAGIALGHLSGYVLGVITYTTLRALNTWISLLKFHIVGAVLLWFIITAHLIVMCRWWTSNPLQDIFGVVGRIPCGFAAYVFLTLQILVGFLGRTKLKNFNGFRHLHVSLWLLILLMACIHQPIVFDYVGIPLLFVVLEKIVLLKKVRRPKPILIVEEVEVDDEEDEGYDDNDEGDEIIWDGREDGTTVAPPAALQPRQIDFDSPPTITLNDNGVAAPPPAVAPAPAATVRTSGPTVSPPKVPALHPNMLTTPATANLELSIIDLDSPARGDTTATMFDGDGGGAEVTLPPPPRMMRRTIMGESGKITAAMYFEASEITVITISTPAEETADKISGDILFGLEGDSCFQRYCLPPTHPFSVAWVSPMGGMTLFIKKRGTFTKMIADAAKKNELLHRSVNYIPVRSYTRSWKPRWLFKGHVVLISAGVGIASTLSILNWCLSLLKSTHMVPKDIYEITVFWSIKDETLVRTVMPLFEEAHRLLATANVPFTAMIAITGRRTGPIEAPDYIDITAERLDPFSLLQAILLQADYAPTDVSMQHRRAARADKRGDVTGMSPNSIAATERPSSASSRPSSATGLSPAKSIPPVNLRSVSIARSKVGHHHLHVFSSGPERFMRLVKEHAVAIQRLRRFENVKLYLLEEQFDGANLWNVFGGNGAGRANGCGFDCCIPSEPDHFNSRPLIHPDSRKANPAGGGGYLEQEVGMTDGDLYHVPTRWSEKERRANERRAAALLLQQQQQEQQQQFDNVVKGDDGSSGGEEDVYDPKSYASGIVMPDGLMYDDVMDDDMLFSVNDDMSPLGSPALRSGAASVRSPRSGAASPLVLSRRASMFGSQKFSRGGADKHVVGVSMMLSGADSPRMAASPANALDAHQHAVMMKRASLVSFANNIDSTTGLQRAYPRGPSTVNRRRSRSDASSTAWDNDNNDDKNNDLKRLGVGLDSDNGAAAARSRAVSIDSTASAELQKKEGSKEGSTADLASKRSVSDVFLMSRNDSMASFMQNDSTGGRRSVANSRRASAMVADPNRRSISDILMMSSKGSHRSIGEGAEGQAENEHNANEMQPVRIARAPMQLKLLEKIRLRRQQHHHLQEGVEVVSSSGEEGDDNEKISPSASGEAGGAATVDDAAFGRTEMSLSLSHNGGNARTGSKPSAVVDDAAFGRTEMSLSLSHNGGNTRTGTKPSAVVDDAAFGRKEMSLSVSNNGGTLRSPTTALARNRGSDASVRISESSDFNPSSPVKRAGSVRFAPQLDNRNDANALQKFRDDDDDDHQQPKDIELPEFKRVALPRESPTDDAAAVSRVSSVSDISASLSPKQSLRDASPRGSMRSTAGGAKMTRTDSMASALHEAASFRRTASDVFLAWQHEDDDDNASLGKRTASRVMPPRRTTSEVFLSTLPSGVDWNAEDSSAAAASAPPPRSALNPWNPGTDAGKPGPSSTGSSTAAPVPPLSPSAAPSAPAIPVPAGTAIIPPPRTKSVSNLQPAKLPIKPDYGAEVMSSEDDNW